MAHSLQRLCRKDDSPAGKPFLRRRGNSVWTVASDGYGMLVVRGALTDNIGGPNVRPVFRQKWDKGRVVSWSRLRRFISTEQKRDEYGSERVRIRGVTLNLALLRRFARGLHAETVTLRAAADDFHRCRYALGTRGALRIDTKDWTLIVMCMIGDRVEATFR